MKDRTEYLKKYNEENRERNRLRSKKHYDEHKDDINKKKKIYHKENETKMKDYRKSIKDTAKVYMKEYKDKIAETQKKYREKNKDKIKKYKKNHNKIYYSNYIRERLKNDELFRLTFNIRSAIRRSFKRKGYCKKSKTEKILGCTFLEFKNHIEAQFEPWMNWTNYGLYNGTPNFGWDIDHILCIKTANTEEDVIKLNHYTNLQPLCSYCNRNIKRCKIQ